MLKKQKKLSKSLINNDGKINKNNKRFEKNNSKF